MIGRAKKIRAFVMRRSQAGVTLIEMILVIGLMVFIALLSFLEKRTEFEQAKARAVGGLIFQYNNAVRAALSQDLSNISAGTYLGTGWLKSTACGGLKAPGSEFLPCDFPLATAASPIPFGQLTFSTAVAVSGTAPNVKFTATTTSSQFMVAETDGTMKVRADLSGIAVLAAASAMNSGYQASAGGGVSPLSATTDSRYNSNAMTAAMTFVASNNAYNDTWLRTDGSNKMHAALQFDGPNSADRAILGASRIQNLAGQAIFIGSGSALAPVTASSVIVGSSAEVLGDFRIRNNMVVDGAATVQSNLGVGGAITAGGQVQGDTIAGKRFIDTENAGYWVDPNGASVFNSIFSDALTVNGNATVAGRVAAQYFLGSYFTDRDDANYYVDPNGTNRLNAVVSNTLYNTGRAQIGEYAQIDGLATENAGCSPNGLLGRDPSGKSLACVNGKWTGGSGVQGSYTFLGNYLGSVTLTSGSKPMLVQVTGGYDVGCGGDGPNRVSLVAHVDGTQVAGMSNANYAYSKTAYISFGVPPNTVYQIFAQPYACGPGLISAWGFNL